MKKVIMIMSLMILLIVTGCSKNEKIEEKEEILKSVYCDSCAEESNEVTKFCSSCGKEAKWLAEKPNLKESKETDKQKVKEEDSIENDKHLDEVKSKDESDKGIEESSNSINNNNICESCGEKFDIGVEGYCSESCYNIVISTKADGYYDNRCKGDGCFYQMSEEEMNERDGYCEECWIQSCRICQERFPRTSLNFYEQGSIIYCDSCDSIARNCKNGFPICDGCEMCI